MLSIEAKDNGVGFDSSKINEHKGIGLTNIKSRAALINASAEIISKEKFFQNITSIIKI